MLAQYGRLRVTHTLPGFWPRMRMTRGLRRSTSGREGSLDMMERRVVAVEDLLATMRNE